MRASSIDDGLLGEQISELEAKIRFAKAARIATQSLEAARTALLVRLADLALEDDAPLPGADAEYRAAREAHVALMDARYRGSEP
jgi:hypothetical protein